MSNQITFTNPLPHPKKDTIIHIETKSTSNSTLSSSFYDRNCKEAWSNWLHKDQYSLVCILGGCGGCILCIGIGFMIAWGIFELMSPD